MKDAYEQIILKATGASKLFEKEIIQSLWSGYGKISRYELTGSKLKTVVVKHIKFPSDVDHPRGWNSNLSHERKVKSYEVEKNWYENHSSKCIEECKVPQCYAIESYNDELLIVLEDLDSVGYPKRINNVTIQVMETALTWLANFHATFLGEIPKGLWDIGTYWHLDTRPDELEVMKDYALKEAAADIDALLNNSKYQTFVHGDAKIANFCFSQDGKEVAAVDFQYIGGGCGMKDVAYFISSCLFEDDCEELEEELLDIYFRELRRSLVEQGKPVDVDDVELELRKLYPIAWTDFHRFLKGWSPGHWKIHSYSERLSREVIKNLKNI